MTASAPPEPSRNVWADLGPRLLSGFVIVAVIATGLYFGGYVYAALAAVVFGITYREWEQMITLKPLAPLGMVLIALLVIAAIAFPAVGYWGVVVPVAIGILIASFADRAIMAWRIGGLAFFGLVLVAVLAMRGTETVGLVAGWYVGITVALNDTGAYFVGRVIGGEKLAPAISPAKTRSGAIGGWTIGTLGGTIFWLIFVPSPWWIGVLLSGAIGISGQVGDLLESAIKRIFRIKDSGDIIPGHGGFMDRLDSVTFAVLTFCLVGTLHAGPGAIAQGGLYW